jgi:hypothetical protein
MNSYSLYLFFEVNLFSCIRQTINAAMRADAVLADVFAMDATASVSLAFVLEPGIEQSIICLIGEVVGLVFI